jgi:erythromycin esterase-like protein
MARQRFNEQFGEQAHAIEQLAEPIPHEGYPFDTLLSAIGDDRIVLIGEASHGTHEFYETRAALTRKLIEQKGFTAVVAEADWPDAWRVNRYVRGINDDRNADEALGGFKRFPQWMWRNTVMLSFVDWLREYNGAFPLGSPRQCGFYGMDLYSMYTSIEEVLRYLDRMDPEAAKRARYRYGCFEHAGEDPQAYGYAAGFNLGPTCEKEVVKQLVELQQSAADYSRRGGPLGYAEHFYAEQNARLVLNAEQYYRSMFEGRISSWNLRDTHMVESLDAIIEFQRRQIPRPKVVVWAHNSHLGDARATEMGRQGELNVGQLVRERYDNECFLVGFTTHEGTVTAASDWEGPAERKRVRPSLPGSYERLFHESDIGDFLLMLGDPLDQSAVLPRQALERAIGVIYLPQSERISHYFDTDLANQFDAVIHLDHTRALEPLERTPEWESIEAPETYPVGL